MPSARATRRHSPGPAIAVVADVTIRPVGIVPSRWDGEGAVEWLAGEPGMIGIHAEQTPATCVVTQDGQPQAMQWPGGQTDLLLRLDDLSIGTSEVSVALMAESGKTIAEGSIVVTVRDPQVRPDGATAGEGIRMLSDPAQPTLSDLWDGRAAISIDGPSSTPATLTVTLLSHTGEELTEIAQEISLPVTPEGWSRTAAGIRADQRFKRHYDDAQSTRVTVSHSGIGFAALTCDRGFQPLRWHLARRRDGSHVARLIDRTDGAQAKVELFTVGDPLIPVPCPPSGDIAVPAQGGLLRATAGEATASALLPTQPNEVMRLRNTAPVVRGTSRTPHEVMRLAAAHLAWSTAERPADPFASRQCDMVLDAITRAIASLIGQSYWAGVERKMKHASDLTAFIDDMEACVGEISSHRKLADRIAHSLWDWSTPEALLTGFTDALARHHAGKQDRREPGHRALCADPVRSARADPGRLEPVRVRGPAREGHRFPSAPARGALRRPGRTRLPRGCHGRRTVVKVSIASPAECGELAVRTLDVDEAADLFSAEGLTASLRRAASFLCPASPRQLINAVLDAVRPLQPGGDLSRDDLADLLDLLVSAGDLLELRRSGDAPGRLLYLGPPSYVERRPGQYLLLGIRPFGAPLISSDLAGAIQYEGHTRTIELSPDRAAAQLSELGLHVIRREQWVRRPPEMPPGELIRQMRERLSAAGPAGLVEGLTVIDPAAKVTYYRGRWRPLEPCRLRAVRRHGGRRPTEPTCGA